MKYSLLIAVLLFFSASSCKKAHELADINFDLAFEQTVPVPATGLPADVPIPGNGLQLNFPAYQVATGISQRLDQYNIKASYVRSITLLHFGWQIPPIYNFNFLDSVQLYISAPGQSEVLAAYNYDVPKDSHILDFKSTGANLKDYLLNDSVTFRMTAHINATPPTGVDMKVNSTFHVLANPVLKK